MPISSPVKAACSTAKLLSITCHVAKAIVLPIASRYRSVLRSVSSLLNMDAISRLGEWDRSIATNNGYSLRAQTIISLAPDVISYYFCRPPRFAAPS